MDTTEYILYSVLRPASTAAVIHSKLRSGKPQKVWHRTTDYSYILFHSCPAQIQQHNCVHINYDVQVTLLKIIIIGLGADRELNHPMNP